MDLLSELQHAEFKEAFDEFDKVRISKHMILVSIDIAIEFVKNW